MALTEVEIFHPIFKKGLDDAGYIERAMVYYDKLACIDNEILLDFIKESQPDNYKRLSERCDNPDERILEKVIESIDETSVLTTLKTEFELENIPFRTFFPKPEKRDYQTTAEKLYKTNKFSYIHELMYYNKEEIDFALFINGLPVASVELKLTTAASHFTYKDAIKQYQDRVNSSSADGKVHRYLDYKTGAMFHLAMDEKEAYVCTKLRGENIYFLPFNRGIGEGIEQSAGNPQQIGNILPTSYIWNNILTPDMLSEIVYEYMFYEPKFDDDDNLVDEILIFPRYHQLTCVEKIVEDIRVNRTSRNYLVQHSAGSGKSNSIVWLAHKLSSLRDINGNDIFASVVIVNDRKVVVKQLQENMKKLDTLVLNELVCITNDKSTKVAQAIDDNKHIIITTVQAFLNVERKLKENSGQKRFAILIDESHSSTDGVDIEKLCNSLSMGSNTATNKPDNVTFIGFTATPKDTTLAKFGTHVGRTSEGKEKYVPFDNYSMRQAIEEGFILDVLASYVEARSHCDVLKISEDDPIVSKKLAKEVLEKFVQHEAVSIADKVDVIMQHFINNIYGGLNDNAKVMIVADEIKDVIEYDTQIKRYIAQSTEDCVKDIKHLVAFSGEYNGKKENDYNKLEAEMTIEKAFDTSKYQILVVCNKYLTGFDQPKLCAMYIDKALHGVPAVQTLSRLNRPYKHPNVKNTYILDFVNRYEDIKTAFSTFYQTTSLVTNMSRDNLVSLYADIITLNIFDVSEVAEFGELSKSENPSAADAARMLTLISTCVNVLNGRTVEERKAMLSTLSRFNRMYLLLRQIIDIPEIEYENLYRFLDNVLNSFSASRGSGRRSLIDSLRKRVVVTADVLQPQQVETTEYEDNGEINKDIAGRTYDGSTGGDTQEQLSVVVEEINIALGNPGSNETANRIIKKLQDQAGLKVYAKRNPYTDYADTFRTTYMKIITQMLKDKEITMENYVKFMKDERRNKLSKATYNLFKD
ncbi:MAG: type I restriction endonuclease subunit R [Roseburia sp.]|nr:type I restriction endonuclease subunit R [Roseburia sp.]